MNHDLSIPVDVSNPGQFFACCGLLELAHRLWPGATARFDDRSAAFQLTTDSGGSLPDLLRKFQQAPLLVGDAPGDESVVDDEEPGDDDDDSTNCILIGAPFDLRLDWWADKSLKPWAGSMNAELIFKAMRAAIKPDEGDPLNDLRVVNDPAASSQPRKKPKKREPFYFDARRGGNAKSLDVGFAPDALSMTSAACPAVESLCMVGLPRFRPKPTDRPRAFEFRTWTLALPPSAAAAAACDLLPGVGGCLYRFENAFRTDQRKHKGFLPATKTREGDAR